MCKGDRLQLYLNVEFFEAPIEEYGDLTFVNPRLHIIYEDENIMLLDKPAGMVVQADEGEKVNTLVNHMLAYLYQKREWKPREENAFTPALCNRIDRNTGGIVIAANNAEALRVLNEKIRERELSKFYLCICLGRPEPPKGRIECFLRKDSKTNTVRVYHHPVPDGRSAVTLYETLETRDRLCMGDLTDVEMLAEHLNALADAFRRYGGKPNMSAWSACCRRYTALFGDYIADTGAYLYDAEHAGKRILLESQSGALRDKDFGVFPYGSPTNCLAAYTPIGAGMPGVRLSRVVGVMKAYSACRGDGPFPAEITGEEATYFRELGQEDEDGATPRRVGGFDAVASRYGVRLQGVDAIALTKLDGTAKGGVALAVAHEHQLPVWYCGTGEGPEDWTCFDAQAFAKALFE